MVVSLVTRLWHFSQEDSDPVFEEVFLLPIPSFSQGYFA